MLLHHSPEKENRSPERDRTHKHLDHIADSSLHDQKRLKARIADYQFELKKLQEDFAEFRLLSGLEKEKAVRRLREELDAERVKNNEESKKWESKFADRQQQWDQERDQYRGFIEEKYRQEKEEGIKAIKLHYEQLLAKAVADNLKMEQEHEGEILDLKVRHQQEL